MKSREEIKAMRDNAMKKDTKKAAAVGVTSVLGGAGVIVAGAGALPFAIMRASAAAIGLGAVTAYKLHKNVDRIKEADEEYEKLTAALSGTRDAGNGEEEKDVEIDDEQPGQSIELTLQRVKLERDQFEEAANLAKDTAKRGQTFEVLLFGANEKIKEYDKKITEKDREIEEKDKKIKAQDIEIEELRRTIGKQAAEISRLGIQVNEQGSELKRQGDEIEQLKALILQRLPKEEDQQKQENENNDNAQSPRMNR